MTELTVMNTAAAADMLAQVLDGVDHAQRATIAHGQRLELIAKFRVLCDRILALTALLIAEADQAGSSMIARGTPLTSWLALPGHTSAKQAAGLVFTGRDVAKNAEVQQAALAGRVQVGQARSIITVLGELSDRLTVDQQRQATRLLLEQAASTPAGKLANLAPTILDAVAPEMSDTPEEQQQQLEAQTRRAKARRGLWFTPNRDGSTQIKGSLPDLDAASLIQVIDSYAGLDRRTCHELQDPLAEERPLEKLRADGLIALIAAHQIEQIAPNAAGDRPRIVVTMTETDLRTRAEQAGILDRDTQISAGDLRRLCCDADVTPVVLGGASEILDVGVTQRLVTPAIRKALWFRDRGCVFPQCPKPAHQCEAHHIIPWWAGGPTSLANLVLLCPHHHGLLEPPKFWAGMPPDRWAVRLDEHGHPEIIPPRRVDPEQKPIPGNTPGNSHHNPKPNESQLRGTGDGESSSEVTPTMTASQKTPSTRINMRRNESDWT